jgi:hypothetical protein
VARIGELGTLAVTSNGRTLRINSSISISSNSITSQLASVVSYT